MYTFHSKVRYSEVSPAGVLSLTSAVNYFQDCSTFQSEELGVGVEALRQSQHAWLLNSWQVVMPAPPALCEEIAVSTWAYDFKGFYGYRNFLMQDKAGAVLAYANSIWVYVDTQTGHPTRCPDEVIQTYPMEPPFPMERSPRKIALPEKLTPLTPFAVPASVIDTNHHVNNCGYVRMAADCLPSGLSYRQMRAEYRTSAVLGDTLFPALCQTDDTCTIALLTAPAGSPYAIIEFSERE